MRWKASTSPCPSFGAEPWLPPEEPLDGGSVDFEEETARLRVSAGERRCSRVAEELGRAVLELLQELFASE
ncbi:hypothetical protein [Amycolatopsis sp. NPDC051128]|uniref:hypothetical protein n=1 Tax=Amycolatopsis sp. NPDC051128 TaxID=3155412 RepID=UPI0034460619